MVSTQLVDIRLNVHLMKHFFAAIFSLTASWVAAQYDTFYFGADLSYVNQMEDCGADYKRGGVSEDPYKIFADVGTNLVRVRLWVDPSWWQQPLKQPDDVKAFYSDLEDVKETIRRVKENGMEALLDFHYSDYWADPSRQLIPRQWLESAEDTDALADLIYYYTKDVLTDLDEEGLMPNIVQIANETNAGLLIHIPEVDGFETAGSVSSANDWSRHAQLINAGISAVREVGESASINPKIALHKADLDGLEWWVDNIISHGVTDFDIIGFSYYYAWHGESISQLETEVSELVEKFPSFELMALETGYLWSDEIGGIIDVPDPDYLPVVPGKQLEYMADYGRAVMRAGGKGVIFWEPAWVDTPCQKPWITGSSHTHVAFFDPVNTNFTELGGGTWPNREYYENLDAPKAIFKVDMTGQEIELSTSTENLSDEISGFELHQNFPNPFNPTTQISYRLPESAKVPLRIFDLAGREIMDLVNSRQPSVIQRVELNASELSSGIYLYKLSTGTFTRSKIMTLIK